MIFGPLGRFALGQIPHVVTVLPPQPPAEASEPSGGSMWDERFRDEPPERMKELDDEDGLVLVFMYAKYHRLI